MATAIESATTASLRAEIENLRAKILSVNQNKTEPVSWKAAERLSPISHPIKIVKTLKGHFGKVYAVHWAGDDKHVVSASQDGKLIVWNAITTNKVHAIPLRSAWVMTCGFEQTKNELVACGGLDNLCSIYRLNFEGPQVTRAEKELSGHDGYLSCCRFIGPEKIVTSSGDSTVILWDVETSSQVTVFKGHTGDVMSVAPHPTDPNIVASGSTDSLVKIWDARLKRCIMGFEGHDSDINAVSYFPDGYGVGSGSDDSSCRLFDSRAMRQLNIYQTDAIVCGITSVAFSASGRLLFAGYDDYSCYGWDVVNNAKYLKLTGHENRVSCLGVNTKGHALCTGSWDTLVKIWA